MSKNQAVVVVGLICLFLAILTINIKVMSEAGQNAPVVTTYVSLAFFVMAVILEFFGWGVYLK